MSLKRVLTIFLTDASSYNVTLVDNEALLFQEVVNLSSLVRLVSEAKLWLV